MNRAARLHEERFGLAAAITVRSPGRINLIGDHTDYCGLPVLPIAIRQTITVAASNRLEPGLVAVSTLDGAIVDSAVTRDRPPWAKYVLAVFDEIRPAASPRGAYIALDSDLPATGGLGSSSALSVGCIFALNEVWGLGLSADKVIEMALAAERKAAIAGGAMDQTVITYARPGHALRIDFDPARLTHIPIPDVFTWIAGYSGTRAPKGESAADSYHSFVLASRAAAALLGDADGDPPQLSRIPPDALSGAADLPTLSVAEASRLAGGERFGLPADRLLDLRASAEHVLSEAVRVDAAEDAIRSGARANLGRLMNESHASLRRYGSSTAALDRLVAAAVGAGASGARVTGAGFGGWAIALTQPDRSDAVSEAMERACGGPTFVATAEGGALWSLTGR